MEVLIVICVITILLFSVAASKKKKSINPVYPPYDFDKERRNLNSINRTIDAIDREKEDDDELYVFKNNFWEDTSDINYLTPTEAQKEFNQRKRDGEYIPDTEYRAYMDALARKNDEKWLEKIDLMAPEEILAWFKKSINTGVRMSSALWRRVHKEVSPMHEPLLLKMLENVQPSRVRSWVATKKKEGYFFTDEVFDKALSKYNLRKTKDNLNSDTQHNVIEIPKEVYDKVKLQLSDVPVDPIEQQRILENLKRSIRRHRKNMKDEKSNTNSTQLYLEQMARYQLITGKDYR